MENIEIVILMIAAIVWCSSLLILEKFICGIKIFWPLCASLTSAVFGLVWPYTIQNFWNINNILDGTIFVWIAYVAILILPFNVICFCYSYFINKKIFNFDVFVALPALFPYIFAVGSKYRKILLKDLILTLPN